MSDGKSSIGGNAHQPTLPTVAHFAFHRCDALPSPGTGELRLSDGAGDTGAQGRHFGRDIARPDDAIDAPRGAATTRAEVKPAVGANFEVGDIERAAFDERARSGRVGRTAALKLDHVDPSERPVADKHRAVISDGIHEVIVDRHAGRRTGTHVDRGR